MELNFYLDIFMQQISGAAVESGQTIRTSGEWKPNGQWQNTN